MIIILLFFYREIAAASGEWVNEFIPNNGKKKNNGRLYVPSTAELIKRNIKRSWTISSEILNFKIDCEMSLSYNSTVGMDWQAIERSRNSRLECNARLKEARSQM